MSYIKILDTALWWSITLLVSSFYIFSSESNGKYLQVFLTGVIGGLCVLRYWKNLNLRVTIFHVWIFLFAVFSLLSSFWALIPEMAIKRGIVIMQSFVYMSVVYVYANHQKSILPLLDCIRWAGYIMTFYLLLVYGWGSLRYLMQESMRIDSDLINSNVIGMILGFSIVLTLYRWIFVKFSVWYLLAFPELVVLSITASRKAFAVLVLGSVAVLGIKYLKKNILTNIMYIFVGAIILLGIGYFLLSLPMFEQMQQRLTGLLGLFSSNTILDESTFMRQQMMLAGFRQIFETPLLGIGIGSTGFISLRVVGWDTYLHNNYAELIASGGIIGTALYYFMHFFTGIPLFLKRFTGNNTLMCFILLALMFLMDWGMVSYYGKGTYFFLLTFFMQVQLDKRRKT